MRSVRLSACLIVRNEARFLDECLRRIRPFVDEIVLVDTGSEDETKAIALRHGARVFEEPWQEDFSRARNLALAKARGEFIFYLDADEWIDPVTAPELRKFHPQVDAYYVTVVNLASLDGQEEIDRFETIRIFRRHPAVRFEGRVHEQILPSLQRIGARLGQLPLRILHYGYAPEVVEAKGKRGRNLRLFGLGQTNTPSDRFHLARELMVAGRFAEAESMLRGILDDPEVVPTSPIALYSRLSLCETLLNLQNHPALLDVADRGLRLFPNQGEFAYYKAAAEAELGHVTAAVRDLLWVLSEPDGMRKLWARGGLKGDAWAFLASLLHRLGRVEEAVEASVTALKLGSRTGVAVFVELAIDRVGVAGVLAALETLGISPRQEAELQKAFLARQLLAAARRLSPPLPESLIGAAFACEGRFLEAVVFFRQHGCPTNLDALAASVSRAALGATEGDALAIYLAHRDMPRPLISPEEIRIIALILAQAGREDLLLSFLERELGPERGRAVTESLLAKVALPVKEVM